MESLTQLLQGLDPSELEKAVKLLQSLKGQKQTAPSDVSGSSAQEGPASPGGAAEGSDTVTADSELPQAPATTQEKHASESASGAEPADEDDVPLALLHFEGVEELLRADEKEQKAALRVARRAVRRAAKRAAREAALQDDTAEMAGAEGVNSATVTEGAPSATKQQEPIDAESKRNPSVENVPKGDAEGKEVSGKEAGGNRAGAAKRKAPTPVVPTHNLATFGFFSSNAAKTTSAEKNRLFTPFVQDKRVIPTELQFWNRSGSSHPGEAVPPPHEEKEVELVAYSTGAGLPIDEESSLLHPPLFYDEASIVEVPKPFSSFNAFIEASNVVDDGDGVGGHSRGDGTRHRDHRPQHRESQPASLQKRCPCSFHTAVTAPYNQFDSEVVFCGFFAVGYDPCQARPPYFGTYNHFQQANLNDTELRQMAVFPRGKSMPRLSTLDYEYDSGDDWDVLEGDEDIAASSSRDSDEDTDNDSLDSSDLDFINDDADDSDSDCELQRRVVEARQRRLNRLRGKDKLIPSFSGPFVGIPTEEHPLRRFDHLERVLPLDDRHLTAMLQSELNCVGGGAYAAELAEGGDGLRPGDADGKRQELRMEAALKNRREMAEDELEVMHELISKNTRAPAKAIIAALRQQDVCIGVATAEIDRTLKRFYTRQHGMLVRRAEPWAATDERLFTKTTKKAEKKAQAGLGLEAAGDEEALDDDDDLKGGKPAGEAEEEGAQVGVAAGASNAASSVPTYISKEGSGRRSPSSHDAAEAPEGTRNRSQQAATDEQEPLLKRPRDEADSAPTPTTAVTAEESGQVEGDA